MNRLIIDRLCVWSGVLAVTCFFGGLVVAGFVPPPAPELSPGDIAALYQDHATNIRIGMVTMLISGMFMSPFVGVISMLMRRIPGISPSLVYAQIVAGTTNTMFFFLPPIIFLATAFRPERDPQLTLLMNDFGWICAVLPWPPAFMQSLVIAIAVLADKTPRPILPRWLGFLNIWIAICYLPGAMLVFCKSGPFAWSGIFVFWLAGPVFVIWFAAMAFAALKALKTSS